MPGGSIKLKAPGLWAFTAVLLIFLTASGLKIYHDFQSCRAFADLAIFSQAAWLLSQGDLPWSTLRGIYQFGDHFNPVMIPVAWLYRLFPSPLLLAGLEHLSLGISAFIIFALGSKLWTQKPWAGFMLGCAWLLYPALSLRGLAPFHPEKLALVFIVALGYSLLVNRGRWALLWALLACCCKEDICFSLIWLSLLLLFSPDNRRTALALLLLSGGYALLVFKLGLPYIASYQQVSRTFLLPHSLAPNDLQAYLRELRQNLTPLTGISLSYLLQLLVPLAFLPLASVWGWACGVNLCENLLSISPFTRFIATQYSTLTAAFLFLGFIDAARRIKRLNLQGIFAVSLLLSGFTWWFFQPWKSIIQDYPAPGKVNLYQECLKAIPPQASVSTQSYFTARLANRAGLYTFPNPFYPVWWEGQMLTAEPDYILVDLSLEDPYIWRVLQSKPVYQLMLKAVLLTRPYRVVLNRDQVMLLHREPDSRPVPGALNTLPLARAYLENDFIFTEVYQAAALEEILKQFNPQNPECLFNLGIWYNHRGVPAKAEYYIGAAARLEPGNALYRETYRELLKP